MPKLRTCQTCGRTFEQPNPIGRPPKFCQPDCRLAARQGVRPVYPVTVTSDSPTS